MKDFVDYVISFYGHGGIYDIEASRDEVILATGMRMGICRWVNSPFEGDTIDREAVRDIILENRTNPFISAPFANEVSL